MVILRELINFALAPPISTVCISLKTPTNLKSALSSAESKFIEIREKL